MDLRAQLLRFVNRYQTVGWLLVLLGGGLVLQFLLWVVLPAQGYSTVLSYLVLPSRLKELVFQPWSLVTWPLFMLKFQPFTLLFSGLILWGFGQIHQHLLGDTRTRRLLLLVVPIVGLLTVSVSSLLPSSPFEAGPEYAMVEDGVASDARYDSGAGAKEPETVTDSASKPAVAGPQVAADRPPTDRKDLLSNPGLSREINLWFPSGGMPLIMVLVFSCATLMPSYPVQLFLFGRVKIIWIAVVLLVLELLWAVFFTPLAIAIAVGAGVGFLHVYLLRNGTDVTELVWSFYSGASRPRMKVKYGDMTQARKASVRSSGSTPSEVPQDIIDGILDKISDKGYESLSREEKELLFKASTQKEDE